MKIAEIDWPLFWQAWRQQNPLEREPWLARWLFADDAVKLSRHPAAPGKIRDNTAQGGEDPVSAKSPQLRLSARPMASGQTAPAPIAAGNHIGELRP